jgi:hypothetical protein
LAERSALQVKAIMEQLEVVTPKVSLTWLLIPSPRKEEKPLGSV